MPFPPPTHGFEEPYIGDSLSEYMIRKPGCTSWLILEDDVQIMNLVKGDAVVIERGRNPHHKCFALVELEGEVFFCQLFYSQSKKAWYAVSDHRKGQAPEEMRIIGVATRFAKDQLL